MTSIFTLLFDGVWSPGEVIAFGVPCRNDVDFAQFVKCCSTGLNYGLVSTLDESQ